MSQKILVIGGSSLVGSTFIDYAPKDSEIFVTLHNTSESKSNNIFEKIDLIKDRNKISEYINKIKPETVIHTVAFPSVDFCETNHELSSLLHVKITRDITKICNKTNSKLIYFARRVNLFPLSPSATFFGSIR